jgi:hypothetical protein
MVNLEIRREAAADAGGGQELVVEGQVTCGLFESEDD